MNIHDTNKMGANIKIVKTNKAIVCGVKELKGCEIEAKDLRGGAGLVLAGLIAEGKTTVNNASFIDRGYENFEKVLTKLGAKVKRL